MLRTLTSIVAALGFGLAASLAHAQATPVGLWKTIDDTTKRERSLVRITDSGGVLTGRIEKSLNPETPIDAVCDKCTDERKGKPLAGMAIVRHTKQSPSDATVWEGGDITDPDNGKVYKLRLTPKDGGKTLEVRGYIGPFFRNQTWLRVE